MPKRSRKLKLFKKLTKIKLKFNIKIALQIISILSLAFLIWFSENRGGWEKKSKPESPPVKLNFEIQGYLAFEKQIRKLAGAPETNQQKQEEIIAPPTLSTGEEEAKAGENKEEAASQSEEKKPEEEAPEIPKPPRAGLIIGVVADAHAGQENGWQKLSAFAWRMANYEGPDIIIDLGDLIESRKNYNNISKKAAEADYRKARSIISRYPVYSVTGNHELLSMSKDNIKNITGRSNYYSVNVKGYNIIVLDSNYNTGRGDNIIYPGTISESEKDWLENKLESSDRNIIFTHHSLYNLTNSDEIEDAIKDNKKRIILIANGHKHPSSLRTNTFGGVKNYEIPSLRFNNQYAIIRINGTSATVTAKRN